MSFGAPEWFWALLAIPGLAALYLRAEHRAAERLREFVSPRLLPQLAATIDRRRRAVRFGLHLFGLALAIVSLAQPRWGYTFQDVKRKGLDLLLAVDTSRSMLSNDVAPNRLERVKLATQDLISQLQGDRVGLIAFAGRAFLQAPLTIDYEAAVESINDLDTKTIPEGGTNISEAISLATQTFGKSAMGNRALIIFTDGEELSGDAVKATRSAAEAGVHIFTIGVGTSQGSLIPIGAEGDGTAFVKDASGQVVKSKLDEKRLQEIAQIGGGVYLHLENGQRTTQQLYTEGLSKLTAAEMDVRLSRQPIERYEWPLTLALLALTLSILIPERKRERAARYSKTPANVAAAAVAILLCCGVDALASVPALDAYREGKYEEAYRQFQETLKSHPNSRAEDQLQFDSGAAAYKLKDYGKALEAFSQALLSPDAGLQSMSHYNLGNTLYQRGEIQPNDEKKLTDWTNALQHYEQTLKLEPQNQQAKDNYEYVKNKIEELKRKREQQPQPSPSPPPPQPKPQKNQGKNQQQSQQNQQSSQNQQQQNQDERQQQQRQQEQAQNKPEAGQNPKPQDQQSEAEAKNEPQQKKQQQPGETPSPSPEEQDHQQPQPSPGEQQRNQPGAMQSPSERQAEESPTPGEGENESPSPSPGEGEGAEETPGPSASPTESPAKKMAGEIKGGRGEESAKPPDKAAELADIDSEDRGKMSERQAEALLESMKDEEARVRLDEHKRARRVYNDW
ncbi:MAG TPA: VWA domain-containing protein [Chthoniobacterales bacterium]|jgi:Ca-activated chloride channel family protein|nr:VWA domain-containing protein [Chthoniobacterales bacterium]